jgi:protein TonB
VNPQLVVATAVSTMTHGTVALLLTHAPSDSRRTDRLREIEQQQAQEKVVEVASLEPSPSVATETPVRTEPTAIQSTQRSAARGPTAPLRAPASPASRGRTKTPSPTVAAALSGHETMADMSYIFQGSPGDPDSLLFGPGSPGRDLSARPMLGGPAYWDCPWPSSANQAGIDRAVVTITVDVAVNGEPLGVHLVHKAPYDFGEGAVDCAKRHRYHAGRNRNGDPISGRTGPITVVFNRNRATLAE